jgi:hypothetical protein
VPNSSPIDSGETVKLPVTCVSQVKLEVIIVSRIMLFVIITSIPVASCLLGEAVLPLRIY